MFKTAMYRKGIEVNLTAHAVGLEECPATVTGAVVAEGIPVSTRRAEQTGAIQLAFWF